MSFSRRLTRVHLGSTPGIVYLHALRKLTREGVVVSLPELDPDLRVGDGVAIENVVLGAAVVVGDVGLVTTHISVEADCVRFGSFACWRVTRSGWVDGSARWFTSRRLRSLAKTFKLVRIFERHSLSWDVIEPGFGGVPVEKAEG